MKKLLCQLLALLTIGGCALAETENKTDEAVLNIFTWEGYIDYSTVIKPFEDETGIKVNYATFSSNEEMYEKLSAVNGGDGQRLHAQHHPRSRADAAVRSRHRG